MDSGEKQFYGDVNIVNENKKYKYKNYDLIEDTVYNGNNYNSDTEYDDKRTISKKAIKQNIQNTGIQTLADNISLLNDKCNIVFDYGNSKILQTLLKFEGTDGSTDITDDTSKNTFTAFNSAQIDTDQYKFGSSSLLLANGTNDYIKGDNALSNYDLSGKDFQMELYVRFSSYSASGNYTIFSLVKDGDNTSYVQLEILADTLHFKILNSGSTVVDLQKASWSPTVGQWYRLVIVNTGDDYSLYIDNERVATANTTSDVNSGDYILYLGYSPVSGNYSIDGWIDEFLIYDIDYDYEATQTKIADKKDSLEYKEYGYDITYKKPIYGTTLITYTNDEEIIDKKYLNGVVKVNPSSSGIKVYLPHIGNDRDGNRLTVQNVSTSNYFWLFQNSTDGYSIDGNDMILVPPRTTVELVFAYEASQWAEIGGRILCTDLIVDIYSDFYNETKLFKILRSLPSKGTNCLLELDFHYDIDDEENPVETIFNVDPVNEEYSILQIYGYYVIINGINKNYSKIRVNSAKIDNSGVNINGLFIGIRTKTDKILLKNFTIQKNFVLTGANPYESHGGLLSTKGCSIHSCKFESIVTDSYENTLPALNIKGDVLVRSCSFVDNFGSAVCSVYFGNTVTVDNTSIASTIKQGFRASFGSRIVDGYANVNQAISPYYKLFGGQIILPNGQAWKDEDDIQRIEAYLSSSYNDTNYGTWQTVALNATIDAKGLSLDTSIIPINKTGNYIITGQVNLGNVEPDVSPSVRLLKGSSEVISINAIRNNRASADGFILSISKEIYLTDSDDIRLQFYNPNSSNTLTIGGGRDHTYLCVALINEIND